MRGEVRARLKGRVLGTGMAETDQRNDCLGS
jgi:hypothetical protein